MLDHIRKAKQELQLLKDENVIIEEEIDYYRGKRTMRESTQDHLNP